MTTNSMYKLEGTNNINDFRSRLKHIKESNDKFVVFKSPVSKTKKKISQNCLTFVCEVRIL